MKRKNKFISLCLITVLSICFLFTMSGCGIKAKPLKNEKLADFSNGESEMFEASDGWSNGSPFNVAWKKNNVTFNNQKMQLSVTQNTEEELTGTIAYDYHGGELRSKYNYGFGDYSIKMKPSNVVGTASTFFTYTGATDNNNPHDEVDIEFLGKDTTKVQFNYFTNGVGGNEHWYNLGFDASKEFHEYGFRWAQDSIIWFIDGKPVYKATKNIPSTPSKIMTNLWCGDASITGWMGEYTNTGVCQSEYEWVSFKSVDGSAPIDNGGTDGGDNGGGDGGNDDYVDNTNYGDPLSLNFSTYQNNYVISNNGTTNNISYTNVTTDYCNINAPVSTLVGENNTLTMKVENTGTTKVSMRIDMFSDALTGDNKALNVSATSNGVAVTTDLTWGGSLFEIGAGKTIYIKLIFTGTPDSIRLFLDSYHYNDTNVYSGSIKITNICLSKTSEN